jgi:hypothetical protein
MVWVTWSARAAQYRLDVPVSPHLGSATVQYIFDTEWTDDVKVISADGQIQRLAPGEISMIALPKGSPHFAALTQFREAHELRFNINEVATREASGTLFTVRNGNEAETYLVFSFGGYVKVPVHFLNGPASWSIRTYGHDAYVLLSLGNPLGPEGMFYLIRFSDQSFRLIDRRFYDLSKAKNLIPDSNHLAVTEGLLEIPALNTTFDLERFSSIPDLWATPAGRYRKPAAYGLTCARRKRQLPSLRMAADNKQLEFELPEEVFRRLIPAELSPSERLADIQRALQNEYSDGFYWLRFGSFDDDSIRAKHQYLLLPRRESSFEPIPVQSFGGQPTLFESPWEDREAILLQLEPTATALLPSHIRHLPHPFACARRVMLDRQALRSGQTIPSEP